VQLPIDDNGVVMPDFSGAACGSLSRTAASWNIIDDRIDEIIGLLKKSSEQSAGITITFADNDDAGTVAELWYIK